MVLLAFLSLALTAVAVGAAVRSLTLSRAQVAEHLEDVAAYSYVTVSSAASSDVDRRPLASFLQTLGTIVARLFGGVHEDEMRKQLVAAGLYSVSPATALGYRVLLAALLACLGLLLGTGLAVRVAFAVLLASLGWILSRIYVQRRGRRRALEIERAIPNLIDQLVVTLEAGIGFSSALQTAANRQDRALGEEMRLVLQEQRMGVSLTDSLQHLRERVDSRNLQSFVRAVIQGERLGVSIGQVMRDLAVDMRKRRRQMAEEQAQKTPVKLLLPLVFLILPTIFIVALLPPMIELINGF